MSPSSEHTNTDAVREGGSRRGTPDTDAVERATLDVLRSHGIRSVPREKIIRLPIRDATKDVQAVLECMLNLSTKDAKEIACELGRIFLSITDYLELCDRITEQIKTISFTEDSISREHGEAALGLLDAFYLHALDSVLAAVRLSHKDVRMDVFASARATSFLTEVEVSVATSHLVSRLREYATLHECNHNEKMVSYLFGLMADDMERHSANLFSESLWLAENSYGANLAMRVNTSSKFCRCLRDYRKGMVDMDDYRTQMFNWIRNLKATEPRWSARMKRSLEELSNRLFEVARANKASAQDLIRSLARTTNGDPRELLQLKYRVEDMLSNPWAIERMFSVAIAYR